MLRLFFGFGGSFGREGGGFVTELLFEFLAGAGGEDFVEPTDFWGLVLAGEDFDDVAVL